MFLVSAVNIKLLSPSDVVKPVFGPFIPFVLTLDHVDVVVLLENAVLPQSDFKTLLIFQQPCL